MQKAVQTILEEAAQSCIELFGEHGREINQQDIEKLKSQFSAALNYESGKLNGYEYLDLIRENEIK